MARGARAVQTPSRGDGGDEVAGFAGVVGAGSGSVAVLGVDDGHVHMAVGGGAPAMDADVEFVFVGVGVVGGHFGEGSLGSGAAVAD